MTWTAGANVNTGDLITAAQWNNYLGTTGSLEYLQSGTQAQPARAFTTVYQNTNNKDLHVSVSFYYDVGNDNTYSALTDSSNPPTTEVAWCATNSVDVLYASFSFVVLENNYYKVVKSGGVGATIKKWTEWL